MTIAKTLGDLRPGIVIGLLAAMIALLLGLALLLLARPLSVAKSVQDVFDHSLLTIAPDLTASPPSSWTMARDCTVLTVVLDRPATARYLFAPFTLDDQRNAASACEILRDTAFDDTSTDYARKSLAAPPSMLHRALLTIAMVLTGWWVPGLIAGIMAVTGAMAVYRLRLSGGSRSATTALALAVILVIVTTAPVFSSMLSGLAIVAALFAAAASPLNGRGAVWGAGGYGAALALLDPGAGIFVTGMALVGVMVVVRHDWTPNVKTMLTAALTAALASTVLTLIGNASARSMSMTNGFSTAFNNLADVGALFFGKDPAGERADFLARVGELAERDGWAAGWIAAAMLLFILVFAPLWVRTSPVACPRARGLTWAGAIVAVPILLWMLLNPLQIAEMPGNFLLPAGALVLAAATFIRAISLLPRQDLGHRPATSTGKI